MNLHRMCPHASLLLSDCQLYCFLYNHSYFASYLPFSTSLSGSSPCSSTNACKENVSTGEIYRRFLAQTGTTGISQGEISLPRHKASWMCLDSFTCKFSRETSYLFYRIRVWSFYLERVALLNASWDYLVAVTKKPNPNWLSHKRNWLTCRSWKEEG